MNDWAIPAHKFCVEKYTSNNYQLMEQLSAHAIQINETFELLIPLFQSFHSKIEKLRVHVPKAASTTSIYHELMVVSETDLIFLDVLKNYEKAMANLSDSLVSPNSWGEEISSVPDISLQQKHMISNITTFQSFSQYICDLSDVSQEMAKFNRIIEEEDCDELKTAVNSIIAERTELLNTDYNKPLDEIMKDEKEDVPLPILKAMYGIYFTPRSLEGVFRQCADSVVLSNYMKLIGIVDIQATDVVNLSGVIRKFLRDLTTPIWPQQLLQPLLEITKNHQTDIDAWVDKTRELSCQLPKHNMAILKHLLALCGRITKSPESKMDDYNMAVCLGLSIFVSKDDIQTTALQATNVIKTFELMIKNKELIFTDIDDCFKRRVNEIITPPIYHDIFCNKRLSMYFTRHRPKTDEGKSRTFNIGKYVAKSTSFN